MTLENVTENFLVYAKWCAANYLIPDWKHFKYMEHKILNLAEVRDEQNRSSKLI